MEDTLFISNLCSFGLTHQEAQIYVSLLNHGEMSGYEVAKDTGISRSNVYASINSLVDKGGAYLLEGEVTKYTPVPVNQFTKNMLEDFGRKADYLNSHAPAKVQNHEGYLTIVGAQNIRNKLRQMISETEQRLYIMAQAEILQSLEADLQKIIKSGKKVVIITKGFSLEGAKIYETEIEEGQLRFISDSAYVLTGEYTGDIHDTALYSGQKNLVTVLKEALKNKIITLEA